MQVDSLPNNDEFHFTYLSNIIIVKIIQKDT